MGVQDMHLRFRQVRYFVEIVDAGSITRAALRLNLVPTALSLQMKKLEDECGVALLERKVRGVEPTAEGREFYRAASRILDLLGEAERVLHGAMVAPNRIRVGLPPSVLHVLGLRTLDAEKAGRIAADPVEGPSSDLVAKLADGQLDFVLGWSAPEDEAINVLDVAEEELVFATSPDSCLPEGPIGLAEALSRDLITLGSGSLAWNVVRRRAASLGLPVGATRSIESAELLRDMLRNGLGSAILPVSVVAPEWHKGTVRVRPLRDESLVRTLSVAWPRSATWVETDLRLIPYFTKLVQEFHDRTAPHCRVMANLSRAGLVPAPDALSN